MIEVVYRFLKILPFGLLKIIMRFFAVLFYVALKKRRKITQKNIKLAIGGSYKAMALKSYFYFADMLATNIKYLGNMDYIKKHAAVRGLEYFKKAKASGNGVIVATAHFSNWEMLACLSFFLGEGIYVMARPIDVESVEKLIKRIRESCGNKVLSSRISAFEFIKLLKNNAVLGILIDQAGGDGSFRVDFFNRKAKVSESVGVFACRLNVAVVPAYLEEENGRFTLVFEEPIVCDKTKPRDEAIYDVMQRLYNRFESWIRCKPYKYFWMHNRWK
ncbi:lysophospholipid acyltransferase family protein [Hippea jasoniae]|uniref:lysophospholipid acyltransferase family protein n=1 Tax=Hippea jasoniae TaxID=944479 RepID=UPI00054D2160|nr:lysophospholipid acyltransferase family protein [Hippea jasoniae]